MPNETVYQKIATYFVFPLVLIALFYYAYRMLDVMIISNTDGVIHVVSNENGVREVVISSCSVLKEGAFPRPIVFTSGDQQDGILVYFSDTQFDRFQLILDGQDYPMDFCKLLSSNLYLNTFSASNRSTLRSMNSWKGSFSAECDDGHTVISLHINTRGCK